MSASLAEFASKIITNVESVIVGKREQIEMLLVAMLCNGHVLLEDVPGTGKTMLARSLAISMGIEFKRLQATPDVLPSDIVGVPVFLAHEGRFEFQPGPIFTNILLTDEINRATPRSQSALLEAMQERQVTIGGETRPLPEPFLVLATQNPVEYEGTFPLPEAQLDRFLLRLEMGYPSKENERQIIRQQRQSHPVTRLSAVVDGLDLLRFQQDIGDIYVEDSLTDYMLELVHRTRSHAQLALGASPRGSLGLFRAAQALAALKGQDFVSPDEVKRLALPVLAHRLILKPESRLRGQTAAQVLQGIMRDLPLDLEDQQEQTP